jgi:hypothetical protein
MEPQIPDPIRHGDLQKLQGTESGQAGLAVDLFYAVTSKTWQQTWAFDNNHHQ